MLGDQPEVNAILVLHRVVDLVDARAQRGDLLRAVVPRVRGREPRDLSAVRLLGQLDRQEGWVDTAFQSDFRRLDLGCIEADVCKLVNTHIVAFFKIYNICRRLHRSKLFLLNGILSFLRMFILKMLLFATFRSTLMTVIDVLRFLKEVSKN